MEHVSKLMDIENRTSDYCFQIMSADHYTNIPGKINILFTMWEFLDVPEAYKKVLDIADYIVVPCQFCKDIFQPYTKARIFVCGEGVEPDQYPFYKRKEPDYSKGERFRIYWAGAPNPRKGYPYMMELIKYVINNPRLEVYLKTTMVKKSPDDKMKEAQVKIDSGEFDGKALEKLKKLSSGVGQEEYDRYYKSDALMTYGPHKNIIFDTRFLPFDDLTRLYNEAHVFAFPTAGEGWGLMGCEAMATGCPTIAPMHTGVKDYFDATVGYPLSFETTWRNCTIYNMKARTYNPYLDKLIELVYHVKDNYKEALEIGKKGSKRVHKYHTWEKKAYVLKSIFDKIEKIEQARKPIVLQESKPVLSICVPTFNMAYTLSALLHGIGREITQDNSHLVELCVSDNASSDDTKKLIDNFIKNSTFKVKYNRFKTNQGFEKNISKAASMADGEYIWFIGADDDIVRGSIDKMLNHIKTGSDMYVCNRIECDHKLAAINRRSWLNGSDSRVFNLETDRIEYINKCMSIGGLFSYIGSLILKRSLWDAIPFKKSWVGLEYIHVFKAFTIFMTANTLEYIKDPYIYCKIMSTEDVLNEKTGQARKAVERILLDLDGYKEVFKITDDPEIFNACAGVVRRERVPQQMDMYKDNADIRYYLEYFKY